MIRRDTTRYRRDARIVALAATGGLGPLSPGQIRAARRLVAKLVDKYRHSEDIDRPRLSRMHSTYPARWRR